MYGLARENAAGESEKAQGSLQRPFEWIDNRYGEVLGCNKNLLLHSLKYMKKYMAVRLDKMFQGSGITILQPRGNKQEVYASR